MTKKNKLILIITSVIIIMASAGIGILKYNSNQYNQRMSEKCIDYQSDGPWAIDCYGVVTINQAFDVKGYYLYDHIHDYELAEIDNLDDYKFENGFMYVKNRAPLNCSVIDLDGNEQFCHYVFQNGQNKDNYYETKSDIPLYLIIETQTGEVKAYKTVDEMPELVKEIFQELEQRAK